MTVAHDWALSPLKPAYDLAMALRRAFYRWLLPAAFVLPLWLLVGYMVFQANVWAILWLLFLAMPAVFVGQLIFTLMVRSRPSVRRNRAVSTLDIAAFGTWHVLTILVGLYSEWFPLFLTLSIIAGIGVFVSSMWQLWQEATGARYETPIDGIFPSTRSAAPKPAPATGSVDGVFIVTEKREP